MGPDGAVKVMVRLGGGGSAESICTATETDLERDGVGDPQVLVRSESDVEEVWVFAAAAVRIRQSGALRQLQALHVPG